ncbi:MAG: DUF1961 family protein [Bacteroidota bacterium]
MSFSSTLIRTLILLVVVVSSCKSSTLLVEKENKVLINWKKKTLLLDDSGTKDWTEQWFLDGKKARIENLLTGMYYAAGPEYKNDTSHAVLWTKDTFSGDIMIEFDYTRTDTSPCCVNIVYFHATGKGGPEYPEDITLWNKKREVPTMSTYFRNMNTYHISFATAGDYIRLRRYDPSKGIRLKGTDIPPDTFGSGMFKLFQSYHIQIVRYKDQVSFLVQNNDDPMDSLIRQWDTSQALPLSEGRIGLRHMYSRAALNKNIKVWQLEEK